MSHATIEVDDPNGETQSFAGVVGTDDSASATTAA